eukprot:gene36394-44146_t
MEDEDDGDNDMKDKEEEDGDSEKEGGRKELDSKEEWQEGGDDGPSRRMGLSQPSLESLMVLQATPLPVSP